MAQAHELMAIIMHAWLKSVTKFKAKTNVYKILNINKTLRESRPNYEQSFFFLAACAYY